MMQTAYAREDLLTTAPLRVMDRERQYGVRFQPMDAWVRTRVVIANHQPIVRHGVRALLAAEPDIEIIGEAENGHEAVQLARRFRPDVVLIDLLMPEVDGIAATRMIRAELPDTQVVVMAGVDEDTSAIESIRAGASAYLLKETRTEALLRAIRGAGAGQIALPAQAAARMVQLDSRPDALSERETEVLRLVARGLANKQIAGQLGIAQSTVKSHVGRILEKLGLLTRTQVALYAARTGLVALEHATV